MTTQAPATPMGGLMMETPLQVRTIAHRAEQQFGSVEVVSVTADGVERSSYGEVVSPRAAPGQRAGRIWASAPATASRASAGTRAATSSSTSPCRRWAPSCTR